MCAIALRELSEVANEIDRYQEKLTEFNLKSERRITMFFVLPTLFLRKIKGNGKLLTKLRTRFRYKALN